MQATTSRIAARVRRIKPSPSTSAADRANELRRQGKSIVNLVVGEPDFDTPAHIRQAAAAAIERGATRYTLMAGTVELREAIVAKLERENGLRYAMNEIIATSGAKSAIYNAFAITLEPGDEVIIPAPYWVSYPDMVLACEGTPVTVACPESQGFKLAPAQLEAAITPRTRWLLLNSPSNPTGASYTAQEYRALAEVLERHPHVMVMTDEIYEHIRFDGETTPHILVQAPSLRDRTLIVNGVSKTYAMTGWRMGWSVWPKPLYDNARKLAVNSHSCVNAPAQWAGLAALTGPQDAVHAMVAEFDRRRRAVVKGLNGLPGVSCITPKGAFYAFPNVSKTGWKAKKLASALLEDAGVATIGGPDFGIHGEGYIRLSYANSLQNIETALERMKGFLEQAKAA